MPRQVWRVQHYKAPEQAALRVHVPEEPAYTAGECAALRQVRLRFGGALRRVVALDLV